MNTLQLRIFSEQDIDFALELGQIAGWSQTRNDWLRFVKMQPEGCFLAEYGEKPAGTVEKERRAPGHRT